MENNSFSDENHNEDFNLRDTVELYLHQWQWFVLSVCLCLLIAYTYLRYATPQYQASTTILVKDDRKGGMLSELSAFADLGIAGGGVKSNLDNEIEILKSRTLVEKTIKELGLNITLISIGNVKRSEVYSNDNLNVNFVTKKGAFYKEQMEFELKDITQNSFKLTSILNLNNKSPLLSNKKEWKFGEIISTVNGDFVINKPIKIQQPSVDESNISLIIKVNPLDNIVGSYLGRLKINPVSKTSSVVEISITDPITNRAEDFLDNLIKIYNEEAATDKSFISESTSRFIANRLLLITEELDGVEKEVQNFKTSNKLTDIETEAELFIKGSNEYNKKRIETEIQMNLVASMMDFIKKSTPSDLLPANIIDGKGEGGDLITSYNQLVLERNRILKSATVENPSVVKLDQQLSSLKTNVKESLSRMQTNLAIQKRDLKGQEGLLDSKIGDIPLQERQFRVIARQQKVKEQLYLYLLQKREETAISLAATEPNARVIDSAQASKFPISPKQSIIYLAALLLGLLIPFSILYVIDLFDTKIKNRFDITSKFDIPFLGDVPKSITPNEIIDATSRTGTAEALRIVKTNLDFMLNEVPEEEAKIIFLTSTVPGEGKTFLSVNLSGTMALSGKKVMLVGMDLRNPKLGEYIESPSLHGLTDYLSNSKASLDDYIFKSKNFENLNILPSGIIPPNPTELLMSKKVGELFKQFKKEYDYVVVDMAPVGMVSDTLMLAKYADATVYVMRANVLDKRMLHLPKTLYKEKKLKNMAVILNDIQMNKSYGYGYGYGYGVLEEKKPWFKRIFKK
jgi:tyrosine-protein kinase Etk/Wzc